MSSIVFLFKLTNGYRMFNQQELQVLLGGVNTPVDINDLRQNTNYGGLYDDQESTIVAFWKVGSHARKVDSYYKFTSISLGRGRLRHGTTPGTVTLRY
jgi:hypothetical protein